MLKLKSNAGRRASARAIVKLNLPNQKIIINDSNKCKIGVRKKMGNARNKQNINNNKIKHNAQVVLSIKYIFVFGGQVGGGGCEHSRPKRINEWCVVFRYLPEWKVDLDGTFLGKCLVDLTAGVILMRFTKLLIETKYKTKNKQKITMKWTEGMCVSIDRGISCRTLYIERVMDTEDKW